VGWSTSELARLTGTTVNTIRHYHKLGLLTEPERMSNGYKQYGASHLLRLHQIRRMRELGIPLADIGAVEDDHEQQQLALKQLESDLGEQIAALEKARTEVSQLLEHGAPIDTAAGFIDIAARMSNSDRALMNIYSTLYEESALAEMRSIMSETTPYDQEVDELAEDADDATRARLAEQIAPSMKRQLEAKPWLLAPTERMTGDVKMGQLRSSARSESSTTTRRSTLSSVPSSLSSRLSRFRRRSRAVHRFHQARGRRGRGLRKRAEEGRRGEELKTATEEEN
jgi:DNA-binding transcriptional MerR regulator